jgi:type I restriction enzyme S subunit
VELRMVLDTRITTTLGDCAQFVSGGTPSKAEPAYWHGDIPWVSAKDMKSFYLDDAEDHVTTIGVQHGTRLATPETTLLLVRGMTLHNDVPICVVRRTMAFNQDVKALVARDGVHPRFLAYWLVGNKHRLLSSVDSAGHGTGRLNTDTLKSLPLELPSEEEQRAIADAITAIDDKIELNRRMTETLEAMARAVFKSWFVDFDPVRAKTEGRYPAGMNAATAALFPSAFKDSPSGKIPKSWDCKPLPELVELNPSRPLRKGAEVPYLDMQNMPVRGHRAAQWIRRPFSSGSRFTNGDTLIARITPCLENGKTAFVDFLPDGDIGWGSTEFIVLRPNPPLPAEFGYCLARSEDFRSHAIQNMTGSSGRQRVPVECLSQYWLVVPPEPIAKCFGTFVASLLGRAKAADEESRTLAAIRDALLPKLISGEVRLGAKVRAAAGSLEGR